MTLRQEVKALFMLGYSTVQIREALPEALPRTLIEYAHVIRRDLTPAEEEVVNLARAARGISLERSEKTKPKLLSPMHILIGSKIYYFRMAQELSHAEFALKYSFRSRTLVSTMEQGKHDFTLSQIQKIADITNTKLEEILDGLSPRRLLPTHPQSPQSQ